MTMYLPYFLARQENGKYVVFNRRGNPVGFHETVDYKKLPVSVAFNITKATAKKLSWQESENLDKIYLYDGSDAPDRNKKNMDAYLVKIQLLLKLKEKPAKKARVNRSSY